MATHMLAIMRLAVGSFVCGTTPAGRRRVSTVQVLLHSCIGGVTVFWHGLWTVLLCRQCKRPSFDNGSDAIAGLLRDRHFLRAWSSTRMPASRRPHAVPCQAARTGDTERGTIRN